MSAFQKMDGEEAVLDLGGIRVEWTRRRPGKRPAVDIEMAIVAGHTYWFLLACQFDPAAEVSADVGKGHHFGLGLRRTNTP